DQFARGGDARLGYLFGQVRVTFEQAADRFDMGLLAELALELRDAYEVLLDAVEVPRRDLAAVRCAPWIASACTWHCLQISRSPASKQALFSYGTAHLHARVTRGICR